MNVAAVSDGTADESGSYRRCARFGARFVFLNFSCSLLELQRVVHMRWMSLLCCLASGFLLCSLGGCGSGGPDAATIEANKKAADLEANRKAGSQEELKKKLTEMAETGAGGTGSGLAGLRSSIESLRSTNPALADALMADFNQLGGARSPEEVKAIAAQMVARL